MACSHREIDSRVSRLPQRAKPRCGCRITLVAAATAFALMSGCAGYQIGQQALYRPDVRTVHVPIFESNSFRRNLGERLAEAIATEIDLKTPYRVVSEERADSVLRGRIIREQKKMIAEDRFDIPRLIESRMVAEIDWIGSTGELLAHTITVPIDEYQLRLLQSDQFVPEAGQSLATSQQNVIEELAEQIVSQMEMLPW